MWTPTKEWDGQEVHIIGGGSSLLNFNFNLFKGLNTIGCNEAFNLGPDIIKFCIFSDIAWFNRKKWDLERYNKAGGKVVSISPGTMNFKLPWLLQVTRESSGVHVGGNKMGWNYSTGAAAINLALSLGGRVIYLYGFDLKANPQKKTHWHTHYAATTPDPTFARFIRGFKTVYAQLARFPHTKIWNVTNGESQLPMFERINLTGMTKRLQEEQK